jgi:uncharacterized membrane-anchored protein
MHRSSASATKARLVDDRLAMLDVQAKQGAAEAQVGSCLARTVTMASRTALIVDRRRFAR